MPKRGDVMVDEIKAWIAERRLTPGDRLPKESELQALFGVSKGTAREALKSLEVQGLVKVTTGPSGGATVGEVPIEKALEQLPELPVLPHPRPPADLRGAPGARARACRRCRAASHRRALRRDGAQHRDLRTAFIGSRSGAGAAPGGSALPRRCWRWPIPQPAAASHSMCRSDQPPAALLGGDGRSQPAGRTRSRRHQRRSAPAPAGRGAQGRCRAGRQADGRAHRRGRRRLRP